MPKIFLTSDTHFGHSKEFLWGPRGFSSSREHDIEIIRNWNSVVAEDDDVYVLGDLMLEDTDYGCACVEQLNGRLHLVRGNHDSDSRWHRYGLLRNVVELCGWATVIKHRKIHFHLSHWPTATANYDDDKGLWAKLISLSGHTHKQEEFHDGDIMKYNVALDAHGNYPVLLEDIIERIKEEFKNPGV
jgi:calcineurin-like phosphoesterase family protein